ncbi:MAG: phytanoyl-CoA dioxygenase family protein [Actinobacteria bacterium]|nr:phytanoyl-CoA dioxygenase family protein [Actinomycetota bacterium]
MATTLTDAQVEGFHRDGFTVVEGFVDGATCDRLRERAVELVDAWEPGVERTVFTTDEQERHSNREFLSSGGRIWCFFEDGALDEAGELTRPKELAINKIGHAQHDLDPVFEEFSYTDDLASVASDIGMADALALQSMYIFKQPGIGGEVSLHCDHTFLWTEPQSVIGFWFAIEDATQENGCLWVHPGGHRIPVKSRYRMTPDLTEARMETLDPEPYSTDDLVPLEADAGTLVLLHGTLPHWSAPNTSSRSRHAYTLHVIDGVADYPADNWLRRPPELPLRGFA